ncbi:MAG: hypothetical protein MZV65_51555 [Chromatiales bacterium]|nr:hypothetical protein [Chromatiales bacterium]
MKQRLSMAGSAVGWLGVLICLVAGLTKFAGSYYLLGYEAMTLFMVGIGLIATGSLAKLEALSR